MDPGTDEFRCGWIPVRVVPASDGSRRVWMTMRFMAFHAPDSNINLALRYKSP
jgi:hypothetical protein